MRESRGVVSNSKKLPIIFALDQDWATAQNWVERIGSEIWGFKIGSILFTEQGPVCVRYLKSKNHKVFLDLKFHDIPNTVFGAVKAAFDLGVELVSIHAAGGRAMLEAVAPLQNKDQHLLAITVLTSLEDKDREELGWIRTLNVQVKEMAALAASCGIHGFVSSPQEVKELRSAHPEKILVTPGVRTGTAQEARRDQKRVGSPEEVLESGSNLIVLGRALSAAKDWEKEWQEIKSSLAGRY